MSSELTHERCSELLLAYAKNELGEADAAEVSGHLEACPECRTELAGLTALLEPVGEGLTGAEAVRLHRGIEAALQTREEVSAHVVALDERRPRRGQRAMQFLGVAAALVVVAVAAGTLFSGNRQGDDAGSADVAGNALESAGGDLSGPRPRFFAAADTRTGGQESLDGGGGGGSAFTQQNYRLALKDRDLSKRANIARLGRDPLLARFSDAYDATDAEELGSAFVDALANEAGEASAEVAECTEGVLAASTGPIVPVLGSFTRFEGDDALVIVFITGQESGRLDRYTIWVWHRGSCETPVHTAFGSVR